MENWPSSRIVRVSRGGKDRHSKVVTSKGLRDRRVRLSVTTAIQFYDLQDRLGFDQPSKALEWLLKAAAGSITELPPISTLFLNDEKMSSTSENSKNSGVSLSRSDEREKENNDVIEKECLNLNPNLSQTTSFTELLSSTRSGVKNEANVFDKMPHRNWSSSSPMDYFSGGFLTTPVTSPLFSDQHQQFSFSPESNKYNNESSEYNLNFTMSSSSGLTGLNRGTLQSNVSNNGSYPSFVFENQNQNHHFFCFGDAQGNNNNNNGHKGKRKN